MSKEQNKFYIYKRTNLINGKIYIGLTTNDPCLRWYNENKSNQEIGKAVREYGLENFLNEIIDTANNLEELKQKEKYWIAFYHSDNLNNGYNQNTGGGGGRSSFKKRYVDINKKLLFNYKKDVIQYLGLKSGYLDRPYYTNYENKESPIWGIVPIEKFYELYENGEINFCYNDLTLYTP